MKDDFRLNEGLLFTGRLDLKLEVRRWHLKIKVNKSMGMIQGNLM